MEKSDNPFFIDLARIVILIFLVIIGWLFGKLFLLLMNGLCGGLDDTKPDVERNCTHNLDLPLQPMDKYNPNTDSKLNQ